MEAGNLIFVGFELTDEVNELFSACSDRDRVYLEDPAHLETISLDQKKYVGKRIKDGAAIDRIEDTARSVVSLLRRVNGNWKPSPMAALVMALQEGDDPEPKEEPESDGESGYDYLSLVD